MVAHAVSEKPYELAYAASIRALQDQAAVVEGLAARAGTLLAAAAIVTSFLGGQAFSLAARHGRGFSLPLVSYTTGAVALFVLVATLTLLTLLPFGVRFSISVASLVAVVDARAATNPIEDAEAFRELALQYEQMYDRNRRPILLLLWYFRLAIVCFMSEVGLWVLVVGRGSL